MKCKERRDEIEDWNRRWNRGEKIMKKDWLELKIKQWLDRDEIKMHNLGSII